MIRFLRSRGHDYKDIKRKTLKASKNDIFYKDQGSPLTLAAKDRSTPPSLPPDSQKISRKELRKKKEPKKIVLPPQLTVV
jgi:hypothetical protein